MGEKMFASLSSGLLARKGAAKPAMRPQGFGQMGASLEDLGWNDMGEAQPAPAPAPTQGPDAESLNRRSIAAALTPVHAAPTAERPRLVAVQDVAPEPEPETAEFEASAPEAITAPEPIEATAPEAIVKPAPVAAVSARRTASKPRAERGASGKAAFTLRLDPARHLRLRLACAVTGRSAQGLVTDALDQYLRSIPELEGLAGQLPGEARPRSER